MVETLISPGVLARENDQSFVSRRPVTVGAAIIGPTVKGPVEVPTVVTTWSEYANKFGTTFLSGSTSNQKTYTYLTSIAAYNYFVNGGTSLLVSRVVNGAYTSATSTNILNGVTSTPGTYATASVSVASFVTESFTVNNEFRITGSDGSLFRFIATSTAGIPADDVDGNIYYFQTGSGASSGAFLSSSLNNLKNKLNASPLGTSFTFTTASVSTPDLIISSSAPGSTLNGIIFSSGSGVTFSTLATLGGGTDGIGSNAFVLETLSEGTIMNSTSTEITNNVLPSGSSDNIRWQIVNANTSSGTFDLLIRRGDDNILEQIILETWTGLSLDPNASNYIARVIGDMVQSYDSVNNQITYTGTYTNRSSYVRVKQVNYTTPNYLNSNGAISNISYTASIPVVASGTFGGATGTIAGGANFYKDINANTQGLVGSDYDNMINLLSNQDDYKFNVLLTPGLTNEDHTSQVSTIITNTQNRGDNIYVLDLVGYGSNVSTVTGQAATRNTSYASSYWPWVQVVEPSTGELVWVPASTVIGGVYAYNDSVAEPWFAPAGINRGGLSSVVRAEQRLSQTQRDSLYTNKINPIASFPGTGVVVYGQKTLQTRASALDRVNVRRLLIALKSYISQIANNLVFEQNTAATRNQFLSQVNPYLTSVQQRQGLYAFKVVMDDSNNTADVIDRNELVGQIYLQPTKTAEFIYLDFNITPTGASFPA